MTTPPRPILIAGLPRSGTTWTMRALGTGAGKHRINEPDNEDFYPASLHGKGKLGRYPALRPGDTAPAYHRLWEWIFLGAHESWRQIQARRILSVGRHDRIVDGQRDLAMVAAEWMSRNPDLSWRREDWREDQQIVVKSIHAQFALEWLSANFDFTPLVLFRHPANVMASWIENHLKDARNATLETRLDIQSQHVKRLGVPPPGPDLLEQMAWRIGLMVTVLEEALERNPTWAVRTHEELCENPLERFQDLYTELGMPWNDEAEAFLLESDSPGEGFSTNRVATEVSNSWQHRLDDAQLETLQRVLGWFPISRWSATDFERH